MHSYVMQELARQRQGDLCRAARLYGLAGPRIRRPVTAARTVRPGGELMRSRPMILVALLLATFR
jgi:hypothetical protein